MKPITVFHSLVTLLFSALLIGVGCFFVLVSNQTAVHDYVIHSLEGGGLIFSAIGLAAIALGALSIFLFLLVYRRQYYLLSSEKHYASIDTQIIRKDLSAFLAQLFPKHSPHCDVHLQKKKEQVKVQLLNFYAELPYVVFEERENVLMQIEEHLHQQLQTIYGYHTKFLFNVSFQENH